MKRVSVWLAALVCLFLILVGIVYCAHHDDSDSNPVDEPTTPATQPQDPEPQDPETQLPDTGGI